MKHKIQIHLSRAFWKMRGELGITGLAALFLFAAAGLFMTFVLQPLKGGFTERIQVPAQAAALQTIATGTGGHFSPSIAALDVKAVYRELGSRIGHKPKTVEVTAAAAGGGIVLMLTGALLSGIWFRRFP